MTLMWHGPGWQKEIWAHKAELLYTGVTQDFPGHATWGRMRPFCLALPGGKDPADLRLARCVSRTQTRCLIRCKAFSLRQEGGCLPLYIRAGPSLEPGPRPLQSSCSASPPCCGINNTVSSMILRAHLGHPCTHQALSPVLWILICLPPSLPASWVRLS
jgi:hypothetical protein